MNNPLKRIVPGVLTFCFFSSIAFGQVLTMHQSGSTANGTPFLTQYWDLIVATTFLTMAVWTRKGLQRFLVPFFIEQSTRLAQIAGFSANAHVLWMNEVAHSLTDGEDGHLKGGRYPIHDPDLHSKAGFLSALTANAVSFFRSEPKDSLQMCRLDYVNQNDSNRIGSAAFGRYQKTVSRALLTLFCALNFAGHAQAQVPNGYLSVRDAPFTARGDGIANDRNAFTKALSASRSIYVPAGTYLIDNSNGPLIAFNFSQNLQFHPQALLLCNTPNQGCLAFEGGIGARFTGLHIAYSSIPVDDCRIPNGMCSTFYIRGTTNARVESTTIDNAWAIAFGFLDNIAGTISQTTINHTTRDGLFLQNNQNVTVADLRVLDAGDDCLGFHDTTAGAGRSGAIATRIVCTRIRGGGLAVAGASNVTVSDFLIDGSSGPGIYVISDPNQLFLKPTDISISNGVIRGVGSVADTVSRAGQKHGIMVYGSASNPLGKLVFSDIHISETSGAGVMGGGFVDDLALNDIQVNHAGLDQEVSNASCVSLTGHAAVTVNRLSVQNCYRAGLLAVTNGVVTVNGLTVTNAWLKAGTEPGAKAVDLFANLSVKVNATVIIDRQTPPTGYVFSERLNGAGNVTYISSQIEFGALQLSGGSTGVRMSSER